ncbi:hypothetical protein PUN28_002401 [Cardiocondyla obscurior]|uniref:C2H2-type domain-containing protein n=1 Tax=Cardiocondyla obscurior TaxID=286306 RepID=A0AAW2GU47_9HYME
MDSQHIEHFTCWTCKVKFTDLAIFRNHYRSEWHRYNMHVTVNGLPPISLEVFQEKEAMYHKNNTSQIEKKQICEICRKTFQSQKQYENHLASKTHKKKLEQKDGDTVLTKKLTSTEDISEDEKDILNENEEEIEMDSEVESLDSDEWLEDSKYLVYENDCLFCNHHSKSLPCIMKHMIKSHSFFVPDLEYCIDISGLFEYLQQKICTDFKCIWCNDSGRQMLSAEAVKMHMIDKGHCKMLFEGETLLEYASFYDYSSSYPDAENVNPDEELPELPEILEDEAYVMKLPSGKSIVHRSLALYYKQNVPVDTTVTIKDYNSWLRKRVFKQISFGTEKRKLEAARMTARDLGRVQRIQAKYSTQLQVKQNKLQKHYRRQIGF